MTFKDILNEMQDLYDKKNHDYGDSFSTSYRLFGLVAPLVRMNDKMNRLNKLYQSDSRVTDESIRDTLIDLANYAVMTVVELDKRDMTVEQLQDRIHQTVSRVHDTIAKMKEYGPGPDPVGPAGKPGPTGGHIKAETIKPLSSEDWKIITAHLPQLGGGKFADGGDKHENDTETD